MNIFSLRSKMKQTFRNFCVGQTSTSTLDQTQPQLFTFHDLHNPSTAPPPSSFATAASTTTSSSYINNQSSPHSPINSHPQPRDSVTLEEMILQLELEEELARRAKLLDEHRCRQQQKLRHCNHHRDVDDDEDKNNNSKFVQQHRMSCVNSSDILRSARNALNQYHPRFSLDGKDSMYRSSFRNDRLDMQLGKMMPTEKRRVGVGEKVVWCKPGVVAKLMGLDALPVPMSKMTNHRNSNCRREGQAGMIKKEINLRRKVQRNEMEKRRQRSLYGSHPKSPAAGYSVNKPAVSSEMSSTSSSFDQAPARDGYIGWRRPSNVNSRPPPFL